MAGDAAGTAGGHAAIGYADTAGDAAIGYATVRSAADKSDQCGGGHSEQGGKDSKTACTTEASGAAWTESG